MGNHALARDENHHLSLMDEKTRRKRILVVDDEIRVLKFVGLKLNLAGYDVLTATNGIEALELVEPARPDLVLLDIMMPGMDGFETLKKLHTLSDIPVIIFTAEPGNSSKAFTLGARDYIVKPFNPDELVKKIRAIMGEEK